MLFGGRSVDINCQKGIRVAACGGTMNAAASKGQTLQSKKTEVVQHQSKAKKHKAWHKLSVCATGRGNGTPYPFNEKLARDIRDSLLSGVTEDTKVCQTHQMVQVANAISIPLFEIRVNQLHSSCVYTSMYKSNWGFIKKEKKVQKKLSSQFLSCAPQPTRNSHVLTVAA